MQDHSLVVTSVAAPNAVLRSLAEGAIRRGLRFYLIGDTSSPSDFCLAGCSYYSLEHQRATGFAYAAACPERHYARKNIGYLLAIREGAEVIIETDDDNSPLPAFWKTRQLEQDAPLLKHGDWINVYRWYTDENVWPRGFPLERVKDATRTELPHPVRVWAPIQQGLADQNPDVDAIYRLIHTLPLNFRENPVVALGEFSWCPFNSQNTTWFADVFPLLYLPAYCSFRMTDIWRSFVAQRIAWTCGWQVLFHGPTVSQQRNEHDLLRDFREEIPGYLHNARIAEVLGSATLRNGPRHMSDNLLVCYEHLVRLGLVDSRELDLLRLWIDDVACASLRQPLNPAIT